MKIDINQEDILNIINATHRIQETLSTDYDPIELFTLNDIISQFVNNTPCKKCEKYVSYKSGIRYTQDCIEWRNNNGCYCYDSNEKNIIQ